MEKHKAIQEDLRKQIEQKRKLKEAQKKNDINFFNNVASKASDVYYINHDRMQADKAMARMQGQSKGSEIRSHRAKTLSERLTQMRTQDNERKDAAQMMQDERSLLHEKHQRKKFELKTIMDLDAAEKRKFKELKNLTHVMSSDYGDNNVLSHLYKKKVNRSLLMGQ